MNVGVHFLHKEKSKKQTFKKKPQQTKQKKPTKKAKPKKF